MTHIPFTFTKSVIRSMKHHQWNYLGSPVAITNFRKYFALQITALRFLGHIERNHPLEIVRLSTQLSPQKRALSSF